MTGISASTNDVFSFSGLSGSGTTATFSLRGGLYQLAWLASAWGTSGLQVLGPDAATWVPITDVWVANGASVQSLVAGQYRFSYTSLTSGTMGVVQQPQANVQIAAHAPSGGAYIVNSITGNDSSLDIGGQNAAQGGAIVLTGGTSSTSANTGGGISLVGGTPGAQGVGGAIIISGGPSGSSGARNGGAASLIGGVGDVASSGAGGAAFLTGGIGGGASTARGGFAVIAGGSAASTNGMGGDATVTGGVSLGSGKGSCIILTPGIVSTGVAGGIFFRGVSYVKQSDPSSLTVSATLTAAQVLTQVLVANQGGAASAAYQLPLATDLQTAMPVRFGDNDGFEFSLINASTVAAEAVSITTNTGWTLVGDMDVQANSSATTKSSGRFLVRRTASNAYALYRLS